MRRANGMGSIYKLKGNRRRPWVVSITDNKERRIIGYFETKTEAEKALSLEYVRPTPKKANITLEQLREEWKEPYYRHISKQTQDNYNAAWKILQPLEKMPFKEIRTNHVQNIIDGSNLGRSSKLKIKALYSLLCKYAAQNDIINSNYAEFLRIDKETKKEKEIFSDLEIAKLEKAAETDKYAQYILMMIYTGFRIAEFLELTPFNVNLDKRVITGGQKTEAGKDRVVPISNKILKYIKANYDKSANTLIHKDDGTHYTKDYFRAKIYRPTLERLDIPYHTPHATRHTFATLLVRIAATPENVERLLGHTDYAFTVDTYVHKDVEDLRAAIDKI